MSACLGVVWVSSLWAEETIRAKESSPSAPAVEAISGEQLEFFENKIRPILAQHCYKCHSAEAAELEGGLYLDSRDGMRRGGDSGPLIAKDDLANSRLLRALRYEDLEMPPEGQLPKGVIADFERWIRMGLPDPRSGKVPSMLGRIDWNEARKFWSFRKPVRHPLPQVRHSDQVVNPIDAFVLRRLEDESLTLNSSADRRSLIRRVYFDLVGLPPTPREVNAFLADPSPLAYEQLVDRLLSSPHYGERWGRHWLDVAGYAESNGIIADGLTPHAWRYRDYVIRALNKDKPYDQFLLEQFAGDELVDWRDAEELTEPMVEALTATGFLRCTPDGTDNQDIFQLEKRWDHIHATVEVALKASMGMVLNCARCHDHKFDPVLQDDYYKVVGLFLPAYDPDNWIPCTDQRKYFWPVRYILNAGKNRREAAMRRLTECGQQIRSLNRELSGAVSRFHDKWLLAQGHAGALPLDARQLAILARSADDRSVEATRIAANLRAEHPVTDAELQSMFPDYARQAEAIESRRRAIRDRAERADLDRIWALWDVSTKPPPSHLLRRGDFLNPGRVVSAGVPEVLNDPAAPFLLPTPTADSTGYRLALAKWLTRPDHPLTARVMVNRIWQYHFGQGIVATPDDFGSQGARPTHPQLLDWLAIEFVESGWSVKALHRLIMTSATYRQSCETDARKLSLDPDNRLLSRWTPRRLEAEVLRDAMLAAGGEIDRRLYGQPVPLEQLPDGQYVVAPDDPGCRRRSIYLRVRRTTPVSFMATFDGPQMDTNLPRRFNSTVPLQSLSLLNNPFVVQASRDFARRLQHADLTRDERIQLAFQIAFSRGPSQKEVAISRSLLSNEENRPDWALFCHGLLASSEFLYVE